MFDSIIEKAKPISLEQPVVTNPFSMLEMTGESIALYIKDIHPENEIQKYFKDHFSTILREVFENNDANLKALLIRPDNIVNFTVAIQSLNEISVVDREYINRLVYGYFSQKSHENDANLKPTYINLSKIVNREVVSRLSVYVLADLAALLAMARFSTTDTNKATKRVNSVLIQQDPSFLTEQKIVDVYLCLYDRITPLFVGVMSDYRNPKQMGNATSENWSMIDLAVLDILENMPTEEIAKVMKSFIDTFKMGYIKQPKFSMDSINTADYPRTFSVYESIINTPSPLAL